MCAPRAHGFGPSAVFRLYRGDNRIQDYSTKNRGVSGLGSSFGEPQGNNGQASAINNRGQITGFAETTVSDSSCPASSPSKTDSPVIWEDGKARALPTVGSDPDGEANAINDQGQAVGYSGTCTTALHAVLWEENGTVFPLPDLGTGGFAFGINNQGQIVGDVASPDGTTFYAALWRNGAITNLRTLPGILPPPLPASTTRAKWWEVPWTLASTGPMPSSGRTA